MKTAIYTYDPHDKVWLVEFADEPRVHSYGRTLAAAKRNIRDAASLWYEKDIDVVDRVEPPDTAKAAVERARHMRAAAEEAGQEAAGAVKDAVVALRRIGLSVREAGEVLGLSFQRISQLSKQDPAGQAMSQALRQAPAAKKPRAKV